MSLIYIYWMFQDVYFLKFQNILEYDWFLIWYYNGNTLWYGQRINIEHSTFKNIRIK